MTITVTELGTAYAALAEWTGEPAEDVQRQLENDDLAHWIAWRDGEVTGALHVWLAPDSKYRLHFERNTPPEAYPALVGKVEGPCVTFVDAEDAERADAFKSLGFEVTRRELQVEIPVARTEYAAAGYQLISAAQADVQQLMTLDAQLRDDVPGAEGWVMDEQQFREEIYDSPYFDSETYLVAIDPSDEYAGLARIWNGPRPLPRLGMIGVLPNHRRRGLARALLSSVFNVLESRGNSTAIAEVDQSNTASRTLLRSFGARTVGVELEMSRI